jgi:hypothetical protein
MERTASIFRVGEYAKQVTSRKQAANKNNPEFPRNTSLLNVQLLSADVISNKRALLSPYRPRPLPYTFSQMYYSAILEMQACRVAQELLNILRNSNIQSRVHKNIPLGLILSQNNPVRTIPSCLSKIHLNVIHPSTYWSV